MGKKVAVLIKHKNRQYEGLRTSLGLVLEDHQVSMFVLNHEVELSEAYKDNMQYLEEMEGERFSNVEANVEKYGFKPVTLVKLAAHLKEYELIIPF